MKLSVLIPTIKKRSEQFAKLHAELLKQAEGKPVQIIYLCDDGTLKVGAKRNMLLDLAQGEYVTFIDDDDIISDEYIDVLLSCLDRKPDAVCFMVMRYDRGVLDRPVKYSCNYDKDYHDAYCYYRMPNHLMCVKKEHAVSTRFPDKNFGEDSDYAKRLLPKIKFEINVSRILYNYMYDSRTSATVNR